MDHAPTTRPTVTSAYPTTSVRTARSLMMAPASSTSGLSTPLATRNLSGKSSWFSHFRGKKVVVGPARGGSGNLNPESSKCPNSTEVCCRDPDYYEPVTARPGTLPYQWSFSSFLNTTYLLECFNFFILSKKTFQSYSTQYVPYVPVGWPGQDIKQFSSCYKFGLKDF